MASAGGQGKPALMAAQVAEQGVPDLDAGAEFLVHPNNMIDLVSTGNSALAGTRKHAVAWDYVNSPAVPG